ncbi:DUF1648 domain-containing protein [Sporosarcina thermotolerans]|uniref:DUF1648 domain-containing protein n=2 Tax=Sporosarcina thermotolerans TaxID=633404 RepID=A0AAW9A609_9BACL|nr:DUF1648 domain-containing protein [Sporosarcina thermotolerans]MDW0116542.1 DUF1648 domain-containing protein [Sporosarcina thermotolerans]WHT48761.1 DUF1648 domain-containing protein [Sporosarcina thermotolerans]
MDKYSYNKPKLDIPKSALQRLFDVVSIIAFMAGTVYLISVWNQLPDQVPAHYNAAGEVNRWGSKWELVILPIIAVLMAVFFTFLEKHPEWHNYMNLNRNNIEFQYKNSILFLNVIKNECVLLFVYLSFNIAQVALGKAESLGILFLPIFLVIMFGSIAFFIIRSIKHK